MSDNPFQPGNTEVSVILNTYPDKVAQALYGWRKATLDRERLRATLHLTFKAGDKKTVSDIEAMIESDDGYYASRLAEISAERQYVALNETLLAAKKEASLRTAF